MTRRSDTAPIERGLGAETMATTDPLAINHLPGSTLRYASLDALRGLAAVAVILFHTSWSNHTAPYVTNGYAAVDLFFLLSGFVMAASYGTRLQTGRQVLAFAERRVFRVYPLHWAVLGWLVLLEAAKWAAQHHGGGPSDALQPAFTGTSSVRLLLANLAFVQGTGLFPETGWNFPSWSVSAELGAYVVFAAAGFAGLLRRPAVVAAGALAGLVGYGVLAGSRGTLDITTDLGLVRCLSGFFIGVALHAIATGTVGLPLRRLGAGLATGLEIIAAVAVVAILVGTTKGAVVAVVPAFMVLLLLIQAERGAVSRALHTRPLQWLGAVSYSIYLVHMPVLTLLTLAGQRFGIPFHRTDAGRTLFDVMPLPGDGMLVVFVAAVLAVAAVTFRYVEEPARLFGRRISSRERPRVADFSRPVTERVGRP